MIGPFGTADEYADVIAQKTIWAEEINNAEAEIERLNGITPEDDVLLSEFFEMP